MSTSAPPRGSAPRGVAYTVAGGTFFAINASVAKVALEAGVDPQLLTILRCLGATAGLGLLVAVTGVHRFRLRRDEVARLAAYGVVGIALVQWLYFVAIDRLSVSLALLLQFTAPILVALWARFALGEAVRSRVWLALALALGGLALVAEVWTGLAGVDLVGVAAALGASCSLAAFWLLGERSVQHASPRDPISLGFWGFVFASLVWSPFMPSHAGELDVLGTTTSALGSFADVSVPVWLVLLTVVVAGTITPFTLEMAALRHITATQVGLVAMLEPMLATLVAWLWLQQVLSGWQVLGVAVIVVGLSLAQTARKAPHPDPDEVPVPT